MLITKTYHFFLFFTFALHFCFITLLVGTPLLALWERLTGKTGAAWMFWRKQTPICISLTITTGIAPLLFSQTLFHRSFYQTFINLFPLPLIGLVMLAIFFYVAYLIKHVEKLALPLTFVQVAFLFSFVYFFGLLYSGLLHPENLRSSFWAGELPPVLWHSTAGYVVAAVVACAVFFKLGGKSWRIRALPLLGISVIVSLVRELMRMKALGVHYPQPLIEHLDISIVVFLLAFVGMIWALVYSFRLAFPKADTQGSTRS